MKLYDIADNHDIRVDCFRMNKVESLAFMSSKGKYFVAIDPFKLCNNLDEKMKLAHELGHCISGAFYTALSPLATWERCEARANLKAIQLLITKDDIEDAASDGVHELWELAERFGLPEDTVATAIEYYRPNGWCM